MKMYRKNPVLIHAVQFLGNGEFDGGQPKWLRDAFDAGVWEWDGGQGATPKAGHALTIHTLEGDHRGDAGDFIIRGVKGELYPCKPDIFAATYELEGDYLDSPEAPPRLKNDHPRA